MEDHPSREPALFRLKLLRSHAIFSILTALLVALVTFYYFQRKLVDNTKEKLYLALQNRGSLIEGSLDRGRAVTLALSGNKGLAEAAAAAAGSPAGDEAARAEVESQLEYCLENCPDVLHAAVLSPDGELLGKAGRRIDEGRQPGFPSSPREVRVGDPCLQPSLPHIFFYGLLNSSSPGPQPRLKVCLGTPDLVDALSDSLNLGESGEVHLGSRRGDSVIFFTSPRLPVREWSSVIPADREAVLPLVMASQGESRLIRSIDYRDVQVLSAFKPVVGTDWGLMVKVDRNAVRGPVWKAALLILFSTAILVSLAMILALKRLGPMADLMVLWSRELEKKIRSRTKKLKKSEEMYRILAESISDGAVILRDNSVMFANKAFRNLVGFPDRGYEGRSFFESVDSREREAMTRRDELRRQGIAPEPCFHSSLVDRAGKVVPVEVVEKEVRYGGSPATLLSVRDIGAKQRLMMYESVIPTCAVCHSVRDDSEAGQGCGHWLPLEQYLRDHSDARMSHTYCPKCETELLEAHNLV